MTAAATGFPVAQHAADNAMDGADEVARFHDRCSDLMRELLCELARHPPERLRPVGDVDGRAAGPCPAGGPAR